MNAHPDHDEALELVRYLLPYPSSASRSCYRAADVRWDLGVERLTRRSLVLLKTVPVPHEPRRGRCVRCGKQLG